MTSQTKSGMSYRLRRIWDFLSLLTVEPYLFLLIFILSLKKIPSDQLAQDKICLQSYGLNTTYCRQLSSMNTEEDYLHKKTHILADVTNFGMYGIAIGTPPSIILSLFIGSWVDNYAGAKKVILIGGAMAFMFESVINVLNDYFYDWSEYLILLNTIPITMAGGTLAIISALWGYIASTTPFHMRALRMTIAEIIICYASPLGSYIAGQVLNTKPMFSGGQIYNYSGVFIIYGIAFAVMLVWTIYRVDEERDIREWELKFKCETEADAKDVDKRNERKLRRFEANRHIHPMKLLFNFNNVKEMLKTCLERRDNNVRLQIWLLFLSMGCFLLSYMGPIIFLYQFAEKVYEWDSKTYSNVATIGSISVALGSMIVGPILVKVLKFRDTTISLVGLVSFFVQNIIRGLVLSPSGFYYSLIPGCAGAMGSIGIRTHYSKIVRPHELGKVYSLLSAIEALAPLIAASLFAAVFNATMDSMPGLALIIVALFLVIPIAVVVWIHNFTVLPDLSHYNDNNNDTKDSVNVCKL